MKTGTCVESPLLRSTFYSFIGKHVSPLLFDHALIKRNRIPCDYLRVKVLSRLRDRSKALPDFWEFFSPSIIQKFRAARALVVRTYFKLFAFTVIFEAWPGGEKKRKKNIFQLFSNLARNCASSTSETVILLQVKYGVERCYRFQDAEVARERERESQSFFIIIIRNSVERSGVYSSVDWTQSRYGAPCYRKFSQGGGGVKIFLQSSAWNRLNPTSV